MLVFISIVMLFLLSRSKRDTQELQQDLNKTIGDYNQLAERFDALSAVKNQLEQQAVKAQTHSEGLQTRLNERDEKIQYLEKELDEEQLRHDQIGGQITALKERFGIASAQAESLQGQLQQAQENVLRKEQEQMCIRDRDGVTPVLQKAFNIKDMHPVEFMGGRKLPTKYNKTPGIIEHKVSIHYGDSDDDILAAKEAGIRGIRLMRAANSTYQPMPTLGGYGEEVLINSNY